MATNIDAINSSNGANAPTPISNAAKGLGKEDFLKLLAVQLQHQNPLEPMENTEFVAQMAQFSTLEGINNMSDNMKVMGEQVLSMNNMNATSLIGKDVKVFGDQVTLTEGIEGADLGYLLMGPAKEVVVTIIDENGTEVRKLIDHNTKAGPNSIGWDGRDAGGAVLPAGKYTFNVSAIGEDDTKIESDALMISTVDGVVYDNSVPYLMIGGTMTHINDVMEVWGNKVTQGAL